MTRILAAEQGGPSEPARHPVIRDLRLSRFFLDHAVVGVLAFGGAYLAGLFLGHALRFAPLQIATVWLAGGVLIAALLVVPRRRWPWIFAATLAMHALVELTLHGSVSLRAPIFGAAHCLEGWVGAVLLQRWLRPAYDLRSRRAMVLFVACAAIMGPAVGASASAAGVALALDRSANFWESWQVLWSANVLGVLALGPAILAWVAAGGRVWRSFSRRRLVENAGVLAMLLLVAQLVFGAEPTPARSLLGFPYLLLPLLLWAALRLSGAVFTSALFFLTLIVVRNGNLGRGPFASVGETSLDHVLSMQAFLAVTLISMLVLSSIVAERRLVEAELRKSQRIMEQAERIAGIASWVWERASNRLGGSEEFYKVYGVSPAERSGFTPEGSLDRIHPHDRDRLQEAWIRTIKTGKRETLDYRVLRPDGTVRALTVEGEMDFDGRGRPRRMVGVIHDVTAEKESEAAAQRSAERFEKVFRSSPDAITISELATGRFFEVNPGFELLTGYRADEAIGRSTLELDLWWDPKDRETLVEQLSTVGRVSELECRFRHKSGEAIDTVIWAEPIQLEEGEYFVAVTRDVTEQKKAEETLVSSRAQLRELAARLQAVREEERRSISREIHDELGQALTALKLDLSWLSARLPDDSTSLRERADSMAELTADTLATVRRISSDLRPAVLDDLGLEAAIQWHAQDFSRRAGMTYRLELEGSETGLDGEIATAVFRILQESLTNVGRHAEATEVDIHLNCADGQLALTIQDNGRGIRAEQMIGFGSVGLLGMRERAEALGGRIRFTAPPKGGTLVELTLPLRTGVRAERERHD